MDDETLTIEVRLARLDRAIEDGRVIRGRWTDGQERACLLAWLSPEAGERESASVCPASVMPPWLAHLTPHLDDRPSARAWPGIVRRYGALAHRWHVLDAAGWERARVASLLVIVREARAHCPASACASLAAIDGVIAWLERGAPEAERESVRRAAAAAWAAEAAAWAGADAADRIALGVFDALEAEIARAEAVRAKGGA